VGVKGEVFDEIERIEAEIRRREKEYYTKKALEEAYNPKNVGKIEDADCFGRVTGPCGDTMEIYMRVINGKIEDCKFLTDGCGATIACGSVLTEMLKGKTLEEAAKIKPEDILSVLGGLPPENLHCPVLAVRTLNAALENFRRRRSRRQVAGSERDLRNE